MLHFRGPLQILRQATQTLSLCMAQILTRHRFMSDVSVTLTSEISMRRLKVGLCHSRAHLWALNGI